jgi:hypothetical protein
MHKFLGVCEPPETMLGGGAGTARNSSKKIMDIK